MDVIQRDLTKLYKGTKIRVYKPSLSREPASSKRKANRHIIPVLGRSNIRQDIEHGKRNEENQPGVGIALRLERGGYPAK